jgi:hypothetical protein
MTTTTTSPATASLATASPAAGSEAIVPQSLSDAAVARMAARITALTPAELVPTNRDPRRAADIVLRSLPALEAQRGLLESMYKGFDFSRLDGLKDAAYAAKYHCGGAHAAPEPEDGLARAMLAAQETRDELLSVARMLVTRKRLSRQVLIGLGSRHASRYSEVAAEITRLVSAFRASWETIAPKSG